MAIRNAEGIAVSFDCELLIEELSADISEFGNFDALVIVQEMHGVDIRKDYNFADDGDDIGMELMPGERVERIKARDLLAIYKQQDSVI